MFWLRIEAGKGCQRKCKNSYLGFGGVVEASAEIAWEW